ncbi:PIN domain-containing protein [Flagellimonas hadalis]|uniref:Nucleotide-binding protein n=1 Tax=Flagellimonas hadalis TaxID=2597517 RepID=A0A5N5INI9_9FLAO|nr:PIN domain-containing protein [Allomuricauda hadalis]KAB5484212.1 nucleotide-binding protein [Allomuricauda hadalis]
MIVVVDTNIVFSAILSSEGKINDLLLNPGLAFHFYTPTFLIEELEKHHEKLKKISGLKDDDIKFLKRTVFNHIDFIDPEIIRPESWEKGFDLVKDIDENDTPFVALCLDINGSLWTGDKKLSNGLKQKGIDWIWTTDELLAEREK